MSQEQKEIMRAYACGWQGELSGQLRTFPPHHAMTLRSPILAARLKDISDYFRKSSLPPRLTELAILLVARHMDSPFEWVIHQQWARDAGLDDRVVEQIRIGERPDTVGGHEAAVHDLVDELLKTNRVSDETFLTTSATLGQQEYVDLVALVGYYALVAMLIAGAGAANGLGEVSFGST